LRHLKLEAKRRLAAGEFATLHDAQTGIAREHGLPSWARLKQACDQAVSAQASAAQEGPALAHLRWVVGRFSGADQPGWPPPAGFEAVTLLRSRVRDRRSYVVLTSRAVTVESLDDGLRRAWLKGDPA
jgi:hypothetical protein